MATVVGGNPTDSFEAFLRKRWPDVRVTQDMLQGTTVAQLMGLLLERSRSFRVWDSGNQPRGG